MPFPIKGLSRAKPIAFQDPGTTNDMLNVVGAPSISDSMGGGSRDGIVKAFDEQVQGSDGSRRINGVFAFQYFANDLTQQGQPATSWVNLGSGTSAEGYALITYPNTSTLWDLGSFTIAGGVAANLLTFFSVTSGTYTNPAEGFDAAKRPTRMLVWDAGDGSGECVYTVGATAVGLRKQVNRYSAATGLWTDLGSNNAAATGEMHALAVCDGKLYVGGSFTHMGLLGTGAAGTCNGIARWSPLTAIGTWDTVPDRDTSTSGVTGGGAVIYCMSEMDGVLYIGGDFTSAGAVANCLGTAQFEPNAHPNNTIKGRWGSIGFLNAGATAAAAPTVQSMLTADIGLGTRLYIGGGFSNWNIGASVTTNASGIGGNAPSDHSLITSYVPTGGPTGFGRFEPLAGGLRGLVQTLDYGVLSLTTYNDGSGLKLWVAGRFDAASTPDGLGTPAPSVATFDGVGWTAPEKGIAGGSGEQVRHLIPAGPPLAQRLFATGDFQIKNNRAVNALGLWDGVKWTCLAGAGCPLASGPSFNSSLASIASLVNDPVPKLYLNVYHSTPIEYAAVYGCGLAPPAIESKASRYGFSTWDGTRFGEIAGFTNRSTSSQVMALLGFSLAHTAGQAQPEGDRLAVGGNFVTTDGASHNKMTVWNGASFESVGTIQDDVYAFASDGLHLFAGGKFGNSVGAVAGAGGVANTYRIAQWNGVVWTALGTGITGAGTEVDALIWESGGNNLYVGGSFGTVSGTAGYGNVARRDIAGASWNKLSAGFNGQVRALAWFGGALYAAGAFTTDVAGPTAMVYVAKFDTGLGQWVAVGGGLTGGSGARCMVVHDDGSGSSLFVGGDFTGAVNTGSAPTCNGIAKWDGTNWHSVDEAGSALAGFGTTLGRGVPTVLIEYLGDLLAAGAFLDAGGDAASYFCRSSP